MYCIQPEVTKASIFELIPQEKIFEKYLGIPVQFKELVCSPLRRDKTPTCGFRYSRSGVLYFKDFSGHFWGSAIDLVMFLYRVNYDKALQIIAEDFSLVQIERGELPKLIPEYAEPVIKEKARFDITWRKWEKSDLLYWNKFYITEKDLYDLRIAPINALWINDSLQYTYRGYNPGYAIVLAPGQYKVYFPLNPHHRFLCNTTLVMGWNQLPERGEICIITKSYKDILVLKKFDIPAVAWQSETIIPDSERVEELKKRFTHTFSLFDFDLTGIRTANKLRKRNGIYPLFFTNGRFGYHNCRAKDAAEYIERHGIAGAKKLIDNFFKVMIYE
jgi:hypothetical protein